MGMGGSSGVRGLPRGITVVGGPHRGRGRVVLVSCCTSSGGQKPERSTVILYRLGEGSPFGRGATGAVSTATIKISFRVCRLVLLGSGAGAATPGMGRRRRPSR